MTKAKWALKSSSLAAVLGLAITTIIGAVAPAQAATASNGASVQAPVGQRAGYQYEILGYNNDSSYDSTDFCEGGMIFQGVFSGPAASTMYVDTVELQSVTLEDEDVTIEDSDIQSYLLPENLYWDSGWNYDTDSYTYAVENCDDDVVIYPSAGVYHYVVTFKGDYVGSITKTVDVVISGDPVRSTFTAENSVWPQASGDQYHWQPVTISLFDSKNRLTTADFFSGDWSEEWSDYNDDEINFANGNDNTDWYWFGVWYETYFINWDTGTVEPTPGIHVGMADENAGNTEVDLDYYVDRTDTDLPTSTASWTTKGWVGDGTDTSWDDDSLNFDEKAGVAIAKKYDGNIDCYFYDCDQGKDDAVIRTDVDSFSLTYHGGSDNADRYIIWGQDNWLDDGTFTGMLDDADNSFVLTNSSGDSTYTVDVADTTADDYFYVYAETVNDDDYNYGIFEDAGFYPNYALQADSKMATWTDVDGFGRDTAEYDMSVLTGSTQNMSFKVTDVWGTAVANSATYLDVSNSCSNTEFKSYDDYNLTNASGVVSFSVTNDNTAAEVEAGGCSNSELYTWFNAYPADDIDYSYNGVYFGYVNSTSVDDLDNEIQNSDTTDGWDNNDWYYADDYAAAVADGSLSGHVYLDTAGITFDDWNFDETWVYADAYNSEGAYLYGVPMTFSATAGGLVKSYYQYYFDNDVDVDEVQGYDVSDFSASSVTTPSGQDSYYVGVSSVTGDVTYTISAGGKSDSYTVNYLNSVWDARYIAAVDTTVDSTIAGDVATATFKVTDRFGNPVKDIAVEFTENGAAVFASSSNAYTDVTDADGLVSIDVLTPAYGNASQDVTATVVDGDAVDANDTQVFDDAEVVSDNYYVGNDFEVAGLSAGESTDNAIIAWSVAAPVVKIGAVKGGVRIIIQGAAGQIAKVWFNGKSKGLVAVGSDAIIKRYKVKKGKTVTVKVAVSNASGLKIAKRKVTVKK